MLRIVLILAMFTCLTAEFSCSNSSHEIKFGTYRQYTSHHDADLEILEDHKFIFNDTRSGSCFAWMKWEGNWTMNNDTLVLTRQNEWEENPVHISSSLDRLSKEISLTFRYEDDEPIQDMMVCYTDMLWGNADCFYTDKKGTLRLPQNRAAEYKDKYPADVKQLYFRKDNIRGLTSEKEQMDDNVFTIVVERKLKTFHVTDKWKFLVARNNLIFLDSNNKSWYDNWGNFNFLTKEKSELRDAY